MAVSEPFKALIELFEHVRSSYWLPLDSTGSGAHGEAVEAALGIVRNCSKDPDFLGAVEIKATVGDKPKIRDLFSCTSASSHPVHRLPSRKQIVEKCGYVDEKSRQALKVSVSNEKNRQGLRLAVEEDWVIEYHEAEVVAAWSLSTLSQRLVEKHAETCWVTCDSREQDGERLVIPVGWVRTANPREERLADLISRGLLTVDHRMHLEGTKVRDRGDQWRFFGDVTDLFAEVGYYTPLGAIDTAYPEAVRDGETLVRNRSIQMPLDLQWSGSGRVHRERVNPKRYGDVCPSCFVTMPLEGNCQSCDS